MAKIYLSSKKRLLLLLSATLGFFLALSAGSVTTQTASADIPHQGPASPCPDDGGDGDDGDCCT